ncbi:MAG: 2OG-Fe(II) oxygenase [Pseudomonadota bacterium]
MIADQLTKARTVLRPTRDEMLQRAPSVNRFWNDNETVFRDAWVEWEKSGGAGGINLDRTLYAPELRNAVEKAWEDPTQEHLVNGLWTEVFPQVYEAQFFDPEKLASLRNFLDRVAEADIPLRPPYGLVLNRGGAMLDPRSEGYLAAPTFQAFYRDLMDHFMRPIARLLFPDVYGYDSQTFGFSIQWKAGKDTTLQAHTDASSVTLNINLNLPGEEFSGSAVRFMDPETKAVKDLTFASGEALIHHGRALHASKPITAGERHNFVLWLFGQNGQTPYPHGHAGSLASAADRWTVPQDPPTNFAPF